MPPKNQRKIGQRPEKETVTLQDTLGDAWKIMKPFVYFSVKAMRVMAHALIFIVKNTPKPEEDQHKSKSNRVIKI